MRGQLSLDSLSESVALRDRERVRTGLNFVLVLSVSLPFVIAGPGSDTDVASVVGIHALRTKIMDVLRQEPYMGEKIPVK